MTPREVERQLRAARAPDEPAAAGRGWDVVRAGFADRGRVRPGRLRRWLPLPAMVVIGSAVGLSPAGAAIGGWVTRTVLTTRVEHASPLLESLPTAGRLLVTERGGTWIVRRDGSRRRLGTYAAATWSPHGRFVLVTRANGLAALDLAGRPRWFLARPHVTGARWGAPDGFRVAYLSGRDLRIVAGDGTGDRLLAAHIDAVAPTWRPDTDHVLAYATRDGQVVLREADSGRVLARTGRNWRPRMLAFSANGTRLLATEPGALHVLSARGRLVRTFDAPRHRVFVTAALSPDGRRIAAVVRDLRTGASALFRFGTRTRHLSEPIFAGADHLGEVLWSPDGRWLLESWPAADQWFFLHDAPPRPRLIAFGQIRRSFGSRPGAARGAPRLEGWCCAPTGTSR